MAHAEWRMLCGACSVAHALLRTLCGARSAAHALWRTLCGVRSEARFCGIALWRSLGAARALDMLPCCRFWPSQSYSFRLMATESPGLLVTFWVMLFIPSL